MNILHSREKDISSILGIYAKARSFMIAEGNPTQWAQGAPNLGSLKKDLAQQASYVVEEKGEILGTFALYEHDENYASIEGKWLNEDPYVVIHRIASIKKGVGTFVLTTLMERYPNIRIDTHSDNVPMKNLLKKMGFVFCGTIHLKDKDGSSREAYMRIRQ